MGLLCLNSPELFFYLLGIALGLGLWLGLRLEKYKNNLGELRQKYQKRTIPHFSAARSKFVANGEFRDAA